MTLLRPFLYRPCRWPSFFVVGLACFLCAISQLMAGAPGGVSAMSILTNRLRGFDATVLTAQETRNLIAELKEAYPDQRFRFGSEIILALTKLGDQETIAESVSKFVESNGRNTARLVQVSQPAIIPLIAEHIFRDEPYAETGDESPRPILPFAAGLVIRQQVMLSRQFPEAVREWARLNVLRPFWANEFRDTFREFYRENEAALKARDYAAVKPPSSWVPPGTPRAAPNAEAQASVFKGGGANRSGPASSPAPTVAAAGQVSPAQPPAGPGATAPASGSRVILVMSALLLVLCGWLFFKPRGV